MKLTCVVLGFDSSADRFTDSVSLYNYAYANFENAKVIDKSETIDNNIKVSKGKENQIDIVYADDFFLTQKRNSTVDYKIEYELPQEISAPIKQGDKVGVVRIVAGDRVVGEVDILSAEDIEKQSFKDIVVKIVDNFGFIG